MRPSRLEGVRGRRWAGKKHESFFASIFMPASSRRFCLSKTSVFRRPCAFTRINGQRSEQRQPADDA